jgi:hypothetical protein
MRILGALGLGLTILILRSLLPEVFKAIEVTLLQFLHLASTILDKGQVLVNSLPVTP